MPQATQYHQPTILKHEGGVPQQYTKSKNILEWYPLLVHQKSSRWTARGMTWFSPPCSRRTSSNLLALSKCQHSEYSNSVQNGPNVGLPCRQGHGVTVQHNSLVNMKGVLKESLGLNPIDPWSSLCF